MGLEFVVLIELVAGFMGFLLGKAVKEHDKRFFRGLQSRNDYIQLDIPGGYWNRRSDNGHVIQGHEDIPAEGALEGLDNAVKRLDDVVIRRAPK